MNERLQWIDMAKGWGILLLIYGHIADDIVSRRFDRLLEVVREVADKKTKQYIGLESEALIEDIEIDKKMSVGRLDNNYLVYFPISKKNIGDIANIKLKEAHNFYFVGEEVD